jgi:hypothetical protein
MEVKRRSSTQWQFGRREESQRGGASNREPLSLRGTATLVEELVQKLSAAPTDFSTAVTTAM